MSSMVNQGCTNVLNELLGAVRASLGLQRTGVFPEGGGGLTSIEQPSREPFCRAFWMILNKSGGGFFNSYHSAMPPVKSSKPSVVAPPESAS